MESILNSERKHGVPKNYFRPPLEPELETAVDKFVATVSGMDIVVGESAHVQAIYSMGNFGTFVGQRQGFANVRCFEPSSSSTAKNVANDDGEMADKQPERFTSTKGRAEKHAADWTKKCVRAQELLHLSPWEAFYLANDLNVLKIVGANMPETLAELFTHFCSIFGPAFVRRYQVYRYFRRIGWVVRDGLTFAVDFLLYKDGVELYHAAAGVRILQSVLDPVVTDPTITATQRELANCKKRLLLAAVDFLLPENKLELKDLELAKVRMLSLSKWSVNKSRISDFKQ